MITASDSSDDEDPERDSPLHAQSPPLDMLQLPVDDDDGELEVCNDVASTRAKESACTATEPKKSSAQAAMEALLAAQAALEAKRPSLALVDAMANSVDQVINPNAVSAVAVSPTPIEIAAAATTAAPPASSELVPPEPPSTSKGMYFIRQVCM